MWVAVEMHAPWWAVWFAAVGSVLVGLAATAMVTVLVVR